MSQNWQRAASTEELQPEGLGHSVEIGGKRIALFKWEGRVFALEDHCPHFGFPLSEGVVQRGEVICSWHGWRVSLSDGRTAVPNACAARFECEVRHNEVWVLMD